MNFAKYDDGFVEYVNGKGVGINDPNSFNTIFEIGPYNTKERGDTIQVSQFQSLQRDAPQGITNSYSLLPPIQPSFIL